MELGISTTFSFDLDFGEKLSMIKQAGFSLISLSGGDYEQSGYLKTLGRDYIREACDRHSVVIDSIHAPLANTIDISHTDSGIREYSVQIMKQAIHACTELSCSLLILHLSNRFPDNDLSDRIVNARHSLDELVSYAKYKNIRIAIENLISPTSNRLFRIMLGEIDDPAVGICFDTSHGHVAREIYPFLSKYGSKIIAVHISDNKGMLDEHMLPYEGSIDWPRFMKEFSQIGYSGTFLLEVEMRESSFKEPQAFLDQAYTRGFRLLELMERAIHE
jgi:L-ribulose-5-phosphate 3-epimerase